MAMALTTSMSVVPRGNPARSGHGEFHRSEDRLPAFSENGSCVVPGDFDGDGHLDLFVGGRVVSRQYGLIPRSYLLQNDGTGHFNDVTVEKAEALAEAG